MKALSRKLLFLVLFLCWSIGTAASANPTERTIEEYGDAHTSKQVEEEKENVKQTNYSSDLELALSEFTVFPVGLNVGSRNVLPTTLIKGSELAGAVGFSEWLIPFDSVTQALGISVSELDNGEWELRSSSLFIRLDPTRLQLDSDLGLVFSVEQIQTLLGVSVQFEQLDYAIRFDPPQLDNNRPSDRTEQPVITEGLPAIASSQFGISGVAQSIRAAGQVGDDIQTRGSFSSLGTVFGGSWYLRTEQSDIGDLDSWRLSEFQYLRQHKTADIALGSQPTFWTSQSGQSSDYWGATYIHRWGFEPTEVRSTSGFNPRQRLQTDRMGRTIIGEADPGTVVQLVRDIRETVIDEVLVDSSGIYRFENVLQANGSGRYQVLLYPNGQLTAIPEERSASFSSLPEQMPVGASALVTSGGFSRQFNTSSSASRPSFSGFVGDIGDFKGGVAYQRGLTESLTLGGGIVQDGNPLALAEAFYAPSGLPLTIAVSAQADLRTAETTIAANAQYRPSQNLFVNLSSDRLSQSFSTEWRVAQGLTLLAKGDTRDGAISSGARFSFSNKSFYVFGNATLDTKSRIRWNLSSNRGALGLRHYGNENTTQSELFYNLSGNYAYGDGHGLLVNYDTRNRNGSFNQLGTLSWRYRSAQNANDGRPLWDMQFGYGIGSSGSGVIASISTAVLPGVELQARYQGVSAFDDGDTFQLELRPRFNLQGGFSPANRHQDRLRTAGGLLLQPFLDENNNGIRDNSESIIREDLDLLLSIDHQNLSRYRPDVSEEGASVVLSPDVYRVDLDPSGYPLNWQADETAYAVSVVAGQYTPVEIPFTRAYTLIGMVLDEKGDALAGQRVEAIETSSDRRQSSVTNAAGVFYLEGLSAGDYRFEIGGKSAENEIITLDRTAEEFQETNFRIMPTGIEVQRILPETPPAVPR